MFALKKLLFKCSLLPRIDQLPKLYFMIMYRISHYSLGIHKVKNPEAYRMYLDTSVLLVTSSNRFSTNALSTTITFPFSDSAASKL